MTINGMNFNENQRYAIEWREGPLLVLAGPGSGKTLVLTHRAASILEEDPDSSILALTFTTKAAFEMRDRLETLMGRRIEQAHLCTFHSFAGDILRQHGSHIGFQPDFSLLTLAEDRLVLLEESIKKLTIDTSLIPADRRNLLVLLDRLFAESYARETKVAGLASLPTWLPELFGAYCETLTQSNRLDYGGLLYFAKKLLSENAGVARLTRLAWQFVCVDEFQDTNRAQYDLLPLIVRKENPNLFIVADDDQIIYQWNGASPERMQGLRQDFQMEVIQLPENFRCPPSIIQHANDLIRHNKRRTPDKLPLIASKTLEETSNVSLRVFADETAEVESISQDIRQAGWNPKDCVVLARASKLLERAARSLEANGMTSYFAQRKDEFQCPSIRWVQAILRLANARHDRELLTRLCKAWLAFREVSISMEDIEAAAALQGGDFLRTWVETALDSETDATYQELLTRTRDNLVDRLMFTDLLHWFLDRTWLDDPLEVEEKATWREMEEALGREHTLGNMALHRYLQEIDLKSKTPPRKPGSIPCMTIHGAKGLEFKHVFLIGLADDVFPSFQAAKKGDTSREMEEERRNCFVAITRVQETLRISYAERYNGYRKNPSRFIREMGLK